MTYWTPSVRPGIMPDDPERQLAKCRACESVYPVNVLPDGSISLIGLEGCPCGDGDFVVFDDPEVIE